MSYDLMVFDPASAPRTHAEFIAWYDQQTEWEEDHGYNDPAVTTPALRAWFMDMIGIFPALNGPFSSEELPEDEALVTDYCIGNSVIYVTFAWSKAEQAYDSAFDLAEKHGLGFFNASSDDAEIWLPVNGKLVLSRA